MPTRRKLSFDELSAGTVPGYSFNVADLTAARRDMETRTSVKETMLQLLEEKLFDTVERLEKGSVKKVAKIYVGKTYYMKKKKTKINHLDPSTWRMDGIGSRFKYHSDNEKNGMVVLGAITKKTLPLEYKSTQKLALALENELTTRCKRRDARIEEKEDDYYSPGKQAKDKNFFCVYIAYKYETQDKRNRRLPQGPVPVIRPLTYLELEAQLKEKSSECEELKAQMQELKDKLGDDKDKVKVKEEPVEHSDPAATINPKKYKKSSRK